MDDLVQTILEEVARDQESQIIRASVTGFDGDSVRVKRFNSRVADPTAWPRVDGLVLDIGDEVLAVRMGSGLVIIGRIVG